jgi:hypothetical protein
MIAIANCVKGLAVPKPPPGPCEAKAAVAGSELAAIAAVAKTRREIRSLVPIEAMTISCDAKFPEDTDRSLFGF